MADKPTPDTREKLEADMREYFSHWIGGTSRTQEAIIGWLDRQAAITERELCKQCEWPSLAAQPDRAACDRIAELTAKLDKANESGGKLFDKVVELTAERDELREYAAEKIAELNGRQRVIETQRDSFKGMELDCANMSKALDMACSEVVELSGSCPFDMHDVQPRDCAECRDQYAECWRLYFTGERWEGE